MTINQYRYFISITFPTNNNTEFILSKSTYNKIVNLLHILMH